MKKTIFSKILFLGLLLSLTVLLTACSYGFKTDNRASTVDDKNSNNLEAVVTEEGITNITSDADLVDDDGNTADVNTVDTVNDGVIGNKKILKLNEKCGDDLGICAPGLKCAYPCGIQGCSNSCLPEDELPRP